MKLQNDGSLETFSGFYFIILQTLQSLFVHLRNNTNTSNI